MRRKRIVVSNSVEETGDKRGQAAASLKKCCFITSFELHESSLIHINGAVWHGLDTYKVPPYKVPPYKVPPRMPLTSRWSLTKPCYMYPDTQ